MAALYADVVPAGLHRAPSIRVAEASKITENVQRDVNIALMNELALVYDRLGLRTEDVLAAARTKWNFAPYRPGLVGGHCIGVDPYYLIAKAEAHGYYPGADPRRPAAERRHGRAGRAEDRGAAFRRGDRHGRRPGRPAGAGVQENVSDARNSQAPVIARALRDLGAVLLAADPLVDPGIARRDLGIEMVETADLVDLDALVLASRTAVSGRRRRRLGRRVRPGGLLVDVTSALDPGDLPDDRHYWSL